MSQTPITCGEATIRLLEKYGVDVVFGIPGVHTLDFCRGLATASIKHVQVRNEQGAGFMADGYARISGRPGVALVISGPGVTNALTAIGQSWADSMPVLLLSSETHSDTHGKGWGALHEITDQRAVTAPMTALSMRATRPEDVPSMLADAFDVFASARPRPVHLSIPIDVLGADVVDDWEPRTSPSRPQPSASAIERAARLLESARRPLILVGGGAVDAARAVTDLAETLNATVVASAAGKGVVPDDHPLSLSASLVRGDVQRHLRTADVTVAIGTELAETDSFIDRLELGGALIRIDIDETKIDDLYPADIGIVSDARAAVEALLLELRLDAARPLEDVAAEVAAVRAAALSDLTDSEQRHVVLLRALRAALPADTFWAGDVCQIVYTGCFALDVSMPRSWSYPAGYCTLGPALPNGIGAKLAAPDRPVVCLAGDGGFMFTVQELMTAVDEGLGIPIVIWDNAGLKQIQDDMGSRGIPLVGVTGSNPDFVALARAMHCDGVIATSLEHAVAEVTGAVAKTRPTVIVVREADAWLQP